jgi:hypothetical protein
MILPTLLTPVPDAPRRIVAHVIEADLRFFRRHPDCRVRGRLYIPGEAGSAIPDETAVDFVLCVLGNGRLTRLYLRLDEERAA